MIIECPSCKTRFSVDSEQIAAVESPQFHCSRCDNLFEISTDQPSHAPTATMHPQMGAAQIGADGLQTISSSPQSFFSPAPIAKQQELALDDFEQSYYSSDESHLVTAEWPSDDNTREYQPDVTYAKAARRQILQSRTPTDENLPTQKSQAQSSEFVLPKIANNSQLLKQNQIHIEQTEFTALAAENKDFSYLSSTSNLKFTSWSWIPCLLTLPVAALIFGVTILKNPDSLRPEISNALRLLNNNLEMAPPQSIAVKQSFAQKVTLHDGNQVLEISGIVENSGITDIDNLRIEARIYDKKNTFLDRKIVSLRNGLVSARLEALSRESISNLQEKAGLGNQTLKSNSDTPIRIAFTQPLGTESHYKLRVYSITKNISEV